MSAGAQEVGQINVGEALHRISEANRAGDTDGVSAGIDAAMAALNRFEARASELVAIGETMQRDRDRLVAALQPMMSTLNYHAGPGSRVAVGSESERGFWRLMLALARAKGKPCPKCGDTGRDSQWRDTDNGWASTPCPLRALDGHDVELPEDVIAFMVTRRDEDRAEDAKPYVPGEGQRIGPPRFEAELEAMGIS